MNPLPPLPDLTALRAAGAARLDAVGWHYIETRAERTHTQSGAARQLLQVKLQAALTEFEARMRSAATPSTTPAQAVQPSPMGALLQHMTSHQTPQSPGQELGQSVGWRAERPRIQQFRQQLSKISVHKQVKQAIALAPANAGPINSHMLVLRSLGLMRDLSPDYLNRFMTHLDTLLCLDEADKGKWAAPKKAAPATKNKS